MSTGVDPTDWINLDSWWMSYTETRPVAHSTASMGGKTDDSSRYWNGVESWWQAQTGASVAFTDSDAARVIDRQRLSECWTTLDPWWDVYTDTGHDTAIELAAVLTDSSDAWMRSAAPFDADPLATDLSENGYRRGPLRPSGEVAWSRWLARLLRPSGALPRELFTLPVEDSPDKVVREEQIPQPDGTFKRPDILVFSGDRGVSIEVKLDDTNYRKTATTARLVEDYYDDHDWTHVLLLENTERTSRLDCRPSS